MRRLLRGVLNLRILNLPDDGWTAVHQGATAIMAWLGMLLLVPGSTFATSTSFSVMASIMPEQLWAGMFWAVALLGWWGLESEEREVRHVSCTILAMAHILVAGCFGMANPLSTGTGTYTVVALLVFGRLVAEGRRGRF